MNDLHDLDRLDDLGVAAETWVAGFPLVVTTRTMQRLGGLLGVNHLVWQTELSGPRSRLVVAPTATPSTPSRCSTCGANRSC